MGKLGRVKTLFRQFDAVRATKYTLLSVLQSLLDGYATTSYGQRGEDRIIWNMLSGIEEGFYVDVGCFHPVRYSNTLSLYKRGWTGLNIDANPEMIRTFRRVRPKDSAVCAVISDEEKEEELYVFEEIPAVNTLHSKYAEEHGWGPVTTQRVTTRTLDSILEGHGVPDSIHLLNIDVEGNELSVLKSLDLSLYQPWIICVEMLENQVEDAMSHSIRAYLDQWGYTLSGFAAMNGYFVHRDRYPF